MNRCDRNGFAAFEIFAKNLRGVSKHPRHSAGQRRPVTELTPPKRVHRAPEIASTVVVPVISSRRMPVLCKNP